MSPFSIGLLVAAAVLLGVTEWARLRRRAQPKQRPVAARSSRFLRPQRKARPKLELVRPEAEEFQRSVERDLAALPTIDEHDVKRH
jgi:hypothetical protein